MDFDKINQVLGDVAADMDAAHTKALNKIHKLGITIGSKLRVECRYYPRQNGVYTVTSIKIPRHFDKYSVSVYGTKFLRKGIDGSKEHYIPLSNVKEIVK